MLLRHKQTVIIIYPEDCNQDQIDWLNCHAWVHKVECGDEPYYLAVMEPEVEKLFLDKFDLQLGYRDDQLKQTWIQT